MKLNETGLFKQGGRDVKYALALKELATDKGALVAHIKSRPNDVLSVIKDGREYDLSDRESADILEEVFGAYSEPDTALLFMASNKFPLARMSELLEARDDLDSLAAENLPYVVVIDTILGVMVRNPSEGLSTYWKDGIPIWCRKLKERRDYKKILNTQIIKGVTVYDLLLLTIWARTAAENAQDVPAHSYAEFDLDCDEAREHLLELSKGIADPSLFRLQISKLNQRRQRWAEKYQLQVKDSTTTLAEERAQEL